MKLKHIIVPTQYFDPEIFQVNHLVSLFLEKGWEVTVIAPAPSYPNASFFQNVSQELCHPNLVVKRFPVIKRNGKTALAIVNSLSYLLFCSVITFWYSLKHPQAVIIAVQYSPFTCIIPAWLSIIILKKDSILWIFDLWPNSISVIPVSSSYVANFVCKKLEGLIRIIYSGFNNIFVSSPSFLSSKCLSQAQASVLYSWEKDVKDQFLTTTHDPINKEEAIHIISIGNLGNAHDLDLIEELLLHTSATDFRWSFVGSGSGMARIQKFCSMQAIKNVQFYGFKSKSECLELCAHADLSLIPFRESKVSDTICFRFVSSLSVGTPVISFGDNSVSALVKKSNCGFVFSKNCKGIYQIDKFLNEISDCVNNIRTSLRESAHLLFEQSFSKSAAERALRHLL